MTSRFRRDMASETTRLDFNDYRLFIGTNGADRFKPREDGITSLSAATAPIIFLIRK